MTTHPLKRFRDATGISATVLGKRLGLTRQSIYRIENGQQSPSVAVLSKVEAATEGQVTLGEMMAAIPDQKPGAAA